jgi:hypothetical protein
LTPSLLVSPVSSVRFPLSLLKKLDRSFAGVFWAVLMGWSVRLVLVALVYKGFLAPARDHWEFAYEIGRVARSIALGRGFSILTGLTRGLLPCSHPFTLTF